MTEPASSGKLVYQRIEHPCNPAGDDWEVLDPGKVKTPTQAEDPQKGAPLYQRSEWIELESILKKSSYLTLSANADLVVLLYKELQAGKRDLALLPVSGSEYIPYTEAWNKSVLLGRAGKEADRVQGLMRSMGLLVPTK